MIIAISCNHKQKKATKIIPEAINDSIISINKNKKDTALIKEPIWGYRFNIKGDFDGDGKLEVLKEYFYSLRDREETNKYYTNVNDFFDFYDSAYQKNCVSFFLCSNKKLDTVPVWGELGPLYVKNEGDLNGDGGDEISFIPINADASSINHCRIVSFKKGKWIELYSFEVREWEVPPLPEGGFTYGLFGTEDSYTNTENNKEIDKQLEKQFFDFKGFVKKQKNGITRIKTFNSMIDDTFLFVNLRKPQIPFN